MTAQRKKMLLAAAAAAIVIFAFLRNQQAGATTAAASPLDQTATGDTAAGSDATDTSSMLDQLAAGEQVLSDQLGQLNDQQAQAQAAIPPPSSSGEDAAFSGFSAQLSSIAAQLAHGLPAPAPPLAAAPAAPPAPAPVPVYTPPPAPPGYLQPTPVRAINPSSGTLNGKPQPVGAPAPILVDWSGHEASNKGTRVGGALVA